MKIYKQISGIIVEIDCYELGCRFLEAETDTPRPPGFTAAQALGILSHTHLENYRAASIAALDYLCECIDKGVKPS